MLLRKIFAASVIASASFCSMAAPGEGGTQVLITGVVVAPPDCKINNGNLIEVNFGNVPIKTADGKQHIQTVDYNLVCTPHSNISYKSMKMMLVGAEGFNNDVLQTNEIPDLGIRFYHDKTPIVLNAWFNLPSQPETMKMEAAPIINPGSTKSHGGAFTASATLITTFQ